MASATTMGVDQAAAIHGSQGNHNHNHSHQHGFGFHSQASGYFVAPSRAAPEWTTANFADPSTPETAALAYASAYNIDSDSQRVPVATPPPQGRKAVGIVRGGRANKKGNVRGGNGSQGRDPTKTVSGGIRLRSIYCATSIQQVLEGEFEQHEEEKDMVTRQLQRLDRSSTAVLIEVIGTVCAPVIYEGFCWRFILRDPTVQDYQQKYPQATHVPLLPSTMPDGSPLSLSCQLFDMENNLNLAHLLARGELVRVIGVTPQPQQKPKDQSLEDLDHCPSSQSGEARFLCVSCRKALADEAQLAIEGSNRCPQPKVM
ncbi:hypothetical protein BG004_001530 [Podila humilis]|nr:hypothetical protein BG004_001530 [Podila humilis]